MTDTTTEPSEAEAPALPIPEIDSIWIDDNRGMFLRVVGVDVDDEGTFVGVGSVAGGGNVDRATRRWWVPLSVFHEECQPFPTGPVPPQAAVWMAVGHRGNQWPIEYGDELTDVARGLAAAALAVEVVRYRVEPTTLTRLH